MISMANLPKYRLPYICVKEQQTLSLCDGWIYVLVNELVKTVLTAAVAMFLLIRDELITPHVCAEYMDGI